MFISIDICGESLYAVLGNAANGNIEVHECDEIRLPEGTVAGGDIKNSPALLMTINKLLSTQKYNSSSAVATFTSSTAISRRLTLPPGKPSEIAGMVRSQISQTIGDPSDYVIEYTYASHTQAKNAPIDIWAYAVERELVDKYYTLLKNAKLRPVALDIHSNCIQKAVSGTAVNDTPLTGRSTVFADIERDFIEIHLFNESDRAFSRIAPVSANDFLMTAGSLGYGRADPSMSLMSKRLITFSLDRGQSQRLDCIDYDLLNVSPETLAGDAALADSARQYIGRISDELLKMIQFQMMRNSSMPVSCVYIYGGLSGIKGFDSSLAQLLSCPVETVKGISKIKIDKKYVLAKYLNAIGALMRLN